MKIKIELVRQKIRELAGERSWTIKEVAERANVKYNTVKSYTRHPRMNMVDLTAGQKIARAFDISIKYGSSVLVMPNY